MATKRHGDRKRDAGDLAEQANRALCDLNQILDGVEPSSVEVVVSGDNRPITLPRQLAETLRAILASAAAGRPVSVIPTHAEFTTQQAAEMLNVSRPYVIKLLDAGEIEYRKVGTHRRIFAESLQAYRKKVDLESKRAADELAQLTEDLGLY